MASLTPSIPGFLSGEEDDALPQPGPAKKYSGYGGGVYGVGRDALRKWIDSLSPRTRKYEEKNGLRTAWDGLVRRVQGVGRGREGVLLAGCRPIRLDLSLHHTVQT